MPKNSQLLLEIGQGLSIMIGMPTIPSWNTKARPKNAKRGTFGYNTDTGCLEYCDGKDWYSGALENS